MRNNYTYLNMGIKELVDCNRCRRQRRKNAAALALAVVLGLTAGILMLAIVLTLTHPYEAMAEMLPEGGIPGPLAAETEVPVEPAEEAVSPTETSVSESDTEYVDMGDFVLTDYCNCRTCCGKWSGGPTASGVMPESGRTIAVDPDVIPLGSRVYIDGYGEYVAEDTGSAIVGARIDVYMDTHEEARHFADGEGSCVRKVWIIQ